MSMRRTLSEIAATSTKAARGAGCPWGLAEEAGAAARVLHAHGLPGCSALAALFDSPRACACAAQTGPASCGLSLAARLADTMPEPDLADGPVAAPLLLIAPLLQDAASRGTCWRLAWSGGAIICGPQGITKEGKGAPDIAAISLSKVSAGSKSTGPTWQSREVEPSAWEALDALAAKTYVPETEASRAAGAGPDAADTD